MAHTRRRVETTFYGWIKCGSVTIVEILSKRDVSFDVISIGMDFDIGHWGP